MVKTMIISREEKEIGSKILIPDTPQIIAALGAAILSRESIEKGA